MRYQVRTERTAQEVLEQARAHFGPRGAGLQETSQNMLSVVFQGGGGYVAIAMQPGSSETVVELETREWDFSVRAFMAQVHTRRRWWWQRWWRQRRVRPQHPTPFHILDNDL